MKDLIIVGAGSFGRELYHLCKECLGYGEEFVVKGFVDDKVDSLEKFNRYPPILGTVKSYPVSQNEVFVCSISNVKIRFFVINQLISRGAVFINLVHKTARVVSTSKLGIGCILGPFVSIGTEVIIGNFCLLQTGVIVGHDVVINENSRIDNYSILVGGVKLSKNTTIHSNSVINGNVIVEEGATIGANSFVIRNVKSGSTVHGNPAKQLT